MQGHSSSSSSLLSDKTRGLLTAAFDFPFDGFATRFARFGRRAFWVCCMANFALCGDVEAITTDSWCLLCVETLRQAQTRGSVLASGLTMPLAKDAALVCSLTFLSGWPH